jgi:hypothetical protein
LAWQNEGIAVSTWRLWNTRTFLDGVRYTFGALKDEEEALKKLKGSMYFETGTVPFKLSSKAKKTLNTETNSEPKDKEPEIMTLSEDEDDVDQIDTPILPLETFPPIGTRVAKASTAAPSASVQTIGGDLDQVLNRLNLEQI